MKRTLLIVSALALLAGCDRLAEPVAPPDADTPAALSRGPGMTATVQFGRTDVGTFDRFPPPSDHDGSFHAYDKAVPGTVVISTGGSVTFEIGPVHRPVVYDAGTRPEDIDTSILANLTSPIFIPNFLIDDPENRLAMGPAISFAPQSWTTPAGTFDEPGRYLVICQVLPHFTDAKMYMWVIVK